MPQPFVVIEGIDGVGKSTVARALAEYVHGKYIETPWAPFDAIRQQVDDLRDLNVRFHYYLSAVIGAGPIIRELTQHQPVICSRYIYSTLAYHRAMGVCVDYLDLDKLPITKPSIAFLLTATEEVRCERIANREIVTVWDQKMQADAAFRLRVQEEYSRFRLTAINTSGRTVADTARELASLAFHPNEGIGT